MRRYLIISHLRTPCLPQLNADKLFFLHLDDVGALNLPPWLPLSDAQAMLLKKLEAFITTEQV